MSLNYNEMLARALIGRRLKADSIPGSYRGLPMFQFWGEDAGIPEEDIHSSQAYRVYLNIAQDRRITAVHIQIDGELLSPCSGYAQEQLDEFDYLPVLNWCMEHLEPIP